MKARGSLFIIIMCIVIIVFPGCGKKNESNTLLQKLILKDDVKEEIIECEPYLANFIDVTLPKEETVSHVSFSHDGKLFCESTYSQLIYAYDTNTWERRIVSLCEEGEYIVELAAGENSIYCLMSDREGTMRIGKVNLSEDSITSISLNNISELKDITIEKLLCDSEEYFYIKGNEAIFVIDKEGQLSGKILLGDMTVSDISLGKSGEVYVLGTSPAKGFFLYKIEKNHNSVTYICKFPGNGNIYTGIESELLYTDNRYLYDYDLVNRSEKVICDLAYNYINPQRVCAISGFNRNEFNVCSWNRFGESDGKTPSCYLLHKMNDAEKEVALNREKQLIRIYKTGKAYYLPDLIFAFQKEYPQYEVILEESDAALEDAEGFTNMKLLTGESPDLIMIDLDNYDIYRDAGALTDLTPYISKSECFSENDFIKQILDPFHQKEAIYALPLSFSVHTLVGNGKIRDIQRKTFFESYEGCTTDGFINFLKKNHDLKFQFDGNPMGILRNCLRCEMGTFYDDKSNTCSFDSNEFQELVMSIYGMNYFDTDFFDPDEWKECAKREKVIAEEQILSFGGVAQLAKVYGNDIVCLGYPTYDGELRTVLEPFEVFGILERSTNKEGAWTFLEYYYKYKDITGIPSVKQKFEQAYKDAEILLDNDKDISRNKDRYLEIVLKLIDAGEIEKPENKQIWEMLEEELPAIYWQGRNPFDVLSIIQSRVQLYLMENE